MTARVENRSDTVWVALTDGPVDASAADAFVRDERAGAVVLFLGTTRAITGSRRTTRLEYEAYEEMALRTASELVAQARERWPVQRVAVLHAIGRVEPREASVCVAVSTPHRADAFEAARFLIDELKREVTIWKKERFEDGSSSWVEPTESKSHRNA